MISWDIINYIILKFVKMKRWFFVFLVIEMVFVIELFIVKCFCGLNKGFIIFSK